MVLFLLMVLLSPVTSTIISTDDSCSPQCDCYYSRGRPTMDCSIHPDQSTVPTIPDGIMSLIMSGCNISTLTHNYFATRHASNIVTLVFDNCRLESLIEAAVFARMLNLERLDLSRNRLVTLPPSTFASLVALRHLSLAHNRLHSLHSKMFSGADQLESLNLGSNHITTIETDTFVQLTKLRELDLSNNALHIADRALFDRLAQLQLLHLQSNPWRCDCELRPMVAWWQQQTAIGAAPQCDDSHYAWDRMQLNEFACGPRLVGIDGSSEQVRSVRVGGNVSFDCVVYGDPTPSVRWEMDDDKRRKKILVPSTRIHLSHMSHSQPMTIIYRLHIINVRSTDTAYYTCVCSNTLRTLIRVFQLQVLVDATSTPTPIDDIVDARRSSLTQPLTIILLLIAGVLVSVAIALVFVCNRRTNDTGGKDDGDVQQRVPTIVYETVIVDQDKMNGDEQRWIGGGKARTVLFDTISDVLDDSGYLEPPAIFESTSSSAQHSTSATTTTDLNRPPLAQHDYETSIMPIRETSL